MNTFLSCDWGTSSFRLRAIAPSPFTILAEICTDDGIGNLAQTTTDHAAFLCARVEELQQQTPCDLSGRDIWLSGMITSSIGWVNMPYAPMPFVLDGSQAIIEHRLLDGARSAWLCSGVAAEHDVMRGEETEILGLFSDPALERFATNALVILPGTHAKHIRIHEGVLTDFCTYMTGELYQLLREHTVLRHSLGTDRPQESVTASVLGAFRDGVMASQQASLSHALFRVRADQVLYGTDGAEQRAYLNGVLLGAELCDIVRDDPADLPIVLYAGDQIGYWYEIALTQLGLANRVYTTPAALRDTASARGHCLLRGCFES